MTDLTSAPNRRRSIFGKLFSRAPIPGTQTPSVLLAVSLTLIPLALLLFNNQGSIANRQPVVEVLLGALAISAAFAIALARKLAPHVAASFVGAFGYGFFSLSWVPGTAGTPVLLVFWIASSVVGAAIVVWLLSDSKLVITLASVAASAIVVALVVLSMGGVQDQPIVAGEAPDSLAFSDALVRTPNVYVFILDGFGRPDVLEEQFADLDLDISPSIERLNELGFGQDASGSANYSQSILSIPSALNGELQHLPDAPLSSLEQWEYGRPALKGENVLVNSFRSAGYDYWHSGSAIWDATACDPDIADLCLGLDTSDQETISAIWSLTPVRNHVGKVAFEDFSDPPSVVDSILVARESQPEDQPYILFSHIISPHQPYRFDADCAFRSRSATGTTLAVGHLPEHRPLYVNQVQCLSQQLEDAMADLVAADPDALILLQADHGSAFQVGHETLAWDDASIEERMAVFRMTRLPGECQSTDIRAQSLVNTPQLLLSCVTGDEPEWVEPQMLLLEAGSTVRENDQALVQPIN